MMAITKAESEREIAHEERNYKNMLRELSGGGYLVRKLKELEERLEKLESFNEQ